MNSDLTMRLLEAAVEQIGLRGYRAVTFSTLAAETGAGKAAIYRRWRTKSELVADALGVQTLIPDAEPRGVIRDDLVELFQIWSTPLNRYESAAASVVGFGTHDEPVRRAIQEHLVTPLRQRVLTVCETHAAAGHTEVPGRRRVVLVHTVRALWCARYSRQSMPDLMSAADVVDRTLIPVLRASRHSGLR